MSKTKAISRREFFRRTAQSSAAVVAGGSLLENSASAESKSIKWSREADVIVIGAGGMGLPAAIRAKECGASVLVIDANFDVGGHAIVSGGNIPLGGGTAAQKKAGIVDSPDIIFSDLTDWSVVEPNGFPDYRYNDRELIRAFADMNVFAFDWLIAHGVTFIDRAPDSMGGISVGNSAPREMHAVPLSWPLIQTGQPVSPGAAKRTSSGIGLIRPLEISARKAGVEILLQHRMTSIIRESPAAGTVLGITVEAKGDKMNLRAKKGVIIATGGSTSNVNFRRIFDPRLTEEYCGVSGEPYTPQDASGEIAAMAIGASLWGTYNQTGEFGWALTKPGQIGCQYGYRNLQWLPESPVFKRARATGLSIGDWQNVICVNQAGKRFYDETAGQFAANNYKSIDPYVPGSYLNAAKIKYEAQNYLNAALAGTGEPVNGGGPIWAIFDADAVKRERWDPKPPNVDIEAGFFFSADTIVGLAARIVNKYQKKPLPAEVLQQTVERYNQFVEAGNDADFGRPTPKYKIQKAPFYAAWATPIIHDTRVGLRINTHCQVQDLQGQVIPGLYCGGESAGGFSQHGLARAIVQGLIAGKHAAEIGDRSR
jgi:succinate dehydrogenase/fumarate reductase flavoprotein subunit